METIITLTSFFEISIVGALVSFVIQWIKEKFGINSNKTKLITLTASLLIGTIWYFYSTADWFVSVIGILGVSSTVWALLLKKGDRK
jgi:hypothetical protein